MAKYLGIDYGLERTGVAASDPEGHLAFPLATLSLSSFHSRSDLLDALANIAKDLHAQGIVFGLPLNDDGSENLTCRQVRNIAKRLQRRLDLPIHFCNEFLSSSQAESELKEAGRKGKKLKKLLDQQAACIILQSFLNQNAGE